MNKVDELISRVLDATGISSSSELARALEINRSGITHARNKNRVPDKWIVKLYRTFNLNPKWIETGTGSVFMGQSSRNDIDFKTVPKVAARLSAGTGSFDTGETVTDYLSFHHQCRALPEHGLLPWHSYSQVLIPLTQPCQQPGLDALRNLLSLVHIAGPVQTDPHDLVVFVQLQVVLNRIQDRRGSDQLEGAHGPAPGINT